MAQKNNFNYTKIRIDESTTKIRNEEYQENNEQNSQSKKK